MRGTSVIRSAISGRASATALAIAAGGPIVPDSPTPFMPPGVTGEGVCTMTTWMSGTSRVVGGR
ncbi:hypothetical protein ACFQQB_23160 [Nonomuraea rubra]|uniref:hypothetical protein n=1 Tax=Nonomuraea rubra TaxID=46180 RepID=UPI003613CEA3